MLIITITKQFNFLEQISMDIHVCTLTNHTSFHVHNFHFLNFLVLFLQFVLPFQSNFLDFIYS